MKKLFTFLILAILCSFSSSAQVVKNESFDGTTFVPAGWTTIYTGGTLYMTRQTAGTFPTCTPHSGAAMMRYNSRTSTIGTVQSLVTPVFDLSSVGTDTARVSFWIYRDDSLPTAYDTLNIMINTVRDTAGATILGTVARSRFIALPDTQAAPGWYQYTFDIPAGFNSTSNYILFRFYTGSGTPTGYRIFLDDISYDTYPAICNGAPTAGTVVPASRVICGGPNVTSLSVTGNTNEIGISYLWQYSTDGGATFTDFGTDSSRVATDTLFATTYFRCAVICTTSNDTSYTAVDSVVVSPDPAPVVSVSPASANYCNNSGIPTLLVASGGLTYSWSPATALSSTSTDSVYAAPTASTTYTVFGYDAYGCFDTATVRVTLRSTPTVTASPITATTCIGDSITLTASSTGVTFGTTVTYNWVPGNFTGASVRVPVDSSTVYYVTGTTNFGCSGPQSTDTVNVTAVATPVAGTITAPDSVICGGNGVTTLTLTGGTSGTSAITYTWSFSSSDTGPWTPLTDSTSSLTTDTLTARTYFICVVACGTNAGDTTNVISINVSPDPIPVVTIPVFQRYYCTGSAPTEVIVEGGEASTFIWTPSTNVVASNDTAFISPTNSTTYTVLGIDTYGCSDTATVRVSVRQIPVVTVTPLIGTICEGDSVTLTASFTVGGGGAGTTTMTYTWEPGTLTGNSITVTPTDTTEYIVTGVSNYGCTGDASVDTASIAVNLLTHASFTSTDQGAGLYSFTNASANATSVFWDFGTGDTSATDSPNYQYVASGLYPVTLIATGICNSDTLTDTLNVIIGGINSVNEKPFTVAPNPAHDVICLSMANKADIIQIIDILGNVIESRNAVSAKEILDVRTLTNGIYFIRITSGTQSNVVRFVKE